MGKNLLQGREMNRLVLVVTVMGALLGTAGPSAADQNWKTSSQLWGRQDRCAREAFKKFPDYTREGNAKREHEFQQCLAQGNLPPRELVNTPFPAPAPPPAGSD